MLGRVFPERIDNRYRGHKLALWLFYPIIFMKLLVSLTAILAPDGGVQSADGIPLDTFGAGGAATVIAVVAFLGLSDLVMGFLRVLAAFRYRAMIPLMYLLIVAGHLGQQGIGLMKPIVRVGAPTGSIVSAALIALSITGLVLSLGGKGYVSRQTEPA